MMRVALAVIAGYLVMIALVVGGDIVFEGWNFSVVNLLLAFPYGFGGGRLAAKIARDREIDAGLILGAAAVVIGTIAYRRNPMLAPLWYWTCLTASLTSGAVYGAFQKFRSVQRSTPRKKKK